MSTAERIKKLRTEHKLTQPELAEKLGYTRQRIADWERGKSLPNTGDIVNLSKIFNTTSDYILCLSTTPIKDLGIQYICDYTGLTKESVDRIKNANDKKNDEELGDKHIIRSFINSFISYGLLEYVAVLANDYILNLYLQLFEYQEALNELQSSGKYDESKLILRIEEIKEAMDLALFKAQKAIILFAQDCNSDIELQINELKKELYSADK